MNTPNISPPVRIDAAKLLQAFESFAGRVASTDDSKEHQKAGVILQRELKGSKIKVSCMSSILLPK